MEIDDGRGPPTSLEIIPTSLDDMDVDHGPVRPSTPANGRKTLSDTSPNLKMKLDELFHYWLARNDTHRLLEHLIADAEAGRDSRLVTDLPASPAPLGTVRSPSSPSPLNAPFPTSSPPTAAAPAPALAPASTLSAAATAAPSAANSATAANSTSAPATPTTHAAAAISSPRSSSSVWGYISKNISFGSSPASPSSNHGSANATLDMMPTGAAIALEPSIALAGDPHNQLLQQQQEHQHHQLQQHQHQEQQSQPHQPKEIAAVSAAKPPFPTTTSTPTLPTTPELQTNTIPPFYFPASKCSPEQDTRERDVIATYFKNKSAAASSPASAALNKSDQHSAPDPNPGSPTPSTIDLPPAARPAARSDIAELVVEAIGLPSFFSGVIYDRITAKNKSKLDTSSPTSANPTSANSTNSPSPTTPVKDPQAPVPPLTEEMFTSYFDTQFAGWSRPKRLFLALLNGGNRDYVTSADFQPLVDALLVCHPGLAFLQATPEFQQRYAETVIERIFYRCARRCDSKLYITDVIRSKLLETLMQVDEEEDLNRERKFFSYEHFYVLYCRFWELDQDHDLLINRDDLLRYGGHSLTFRVVDRIFEGCGRPLDCKGEGFMSYTDFIWFCLSEEDKTSETAIDYWFRCVDLDGDGLVTMYDIEHFYTEQLHRMECLGHEPVQLEDILCQLLDMIKPNLEPPQIRRSALRQCRLASNFFNVLFNLNKFFSLESRDPLQIRQEHATPELSDWDRFATIEYLRLSAEEEGEDEMEDGWDELDENRMLELQEPQF